MFSLKCKRLVERLGLDWFRKKSGKMYSLSTVLVRSYVQTYGNKVLSKDYEARRTWGRIGSIVVQNGKIRKIRRGERRILDGGYYRMIDGEECLTRDVISILVETF